VSWLLAFRMLSSSLWLVEMCPPTHRCTQLQKCKGYGAHCLRLMYTARCRPYPPAMDVCEPCLTPSDSADHAVRAIHVPMRVHREGCQHKCTRTCTYSHIVMDLQPETVPSFKTKAVGVLALSDDGRDITVGNLRRRRRETTRGCDMLVNGHFLRTDARITSMGKALEV
jgi:hypothetical protein